MSPVKRRQPIKVPYFTKSPSISNPPGTRPPEILSYYVLRRAAGWIGIFLPLAVAFLTICIDTHHSLPDSISASYYTVGRNYFVGSLCSVGIFLICAVGYSEDRFLSFFAGAMAFLVAFSPCTPPPCSCIPIHYHSNIIHGVAACLLFFDFAYICLRRFTLSAPPLSDTQALAPLSAEKKNRNFVFRLCGSVMVVAMFFQLIAPLLRRVTGRRLDHLTYAVETVCLIAFGVAWNVKGQQWFPDKEWI